MNPVHSFLSIPFALLLKKEKAKAGYLLTTLSSETGLQNFFAYRNSKSSNIKSIEPFSLIEITAKIPSSSRMHPSVIDLSLLFSFSPPFMEFFHFYALQNLLHKNLSLLFSHIDQETSKIFLLLLTFFQKSPEVKTPKMSYTFLIAFFWKWIAITKVHDDILYCHFCKTRLIRNPYTHADIWEWNQKLLCDACRKRENLLQVQTLSSSCQYQLYQLLYAPLQDIAQISFQTSLLSFVNQYLETFLYLSPKEALSKKHNPFTDL